MKRFFFLFFTLVVTGAAVAQGIATRISGHLDGIGDTIKYQHDDNSEKVGMTFGFAPVVNGSFDFTVHIEHPALLLFTDARLNGQSDDGVFHGVGFKLIPGENAVVTGSLDDYTIGGSPIYERFSAVFVPFVRQFNGVGVEKWDSIRHAYGASCIDYITKHPDDEAGVLLLEGLNDDDFDKALALLSPKVREGRLASIWEKRLQERERAEQRQAAAAKVGEGTEAPDFTLNGIDGKPLQLSALRGKYVVLDFWGSWCAPCMNGMAAMKVFYEKYKGRFEMIGINCGDSEEKWKEAVKHKGMNWTQLRESKESQQVAQLYAVSSFPTKIIIGPDGKIINRMAGETSQFYECLDGLFGQ